VQDLSLLDQPTEAAIITRGAFLRIWKIA